MKFAFHTLGCKVNQFETQSLQLILSKKGHSVVDDFAIADVIVVNTCSVTSTSDRKSRRIIRHFAKTYPNAKIAVCGCLSQLSPDNIAKIDGVSLVSGTSDKKAFAEALHRLSEGEKTELAIDKPLSRKEFELLPAGGIFGHTRALLKIEDGCTNFCTYCIIPYTRGPVRSMPIETAISECNKLLLEGYKEIVITGIEIASYGRDLTPKSSLYEIISVLCEKFPTIRFRLGSIEPRIITEEFCVKLSSFTNLCPHFHLSMQSGCDETLARMHRKYDTARFYESVVLLRKYFPECAITTDMIVGFPGEDEEEFSKTLSFIEKCRFASMHIFPYSRRAGTPADKMENQLTQSEKAQRASRGAEIANKMKQEYLNSRIGKTEAVLFEEIDNGYWCGHAKNSVMVYVKSDTDLSNTVCDILIKETFKDGLLGEIIEA